MTAAGVAAMLSAMPRGVPRGSDVRAVVVSTVQEVDSASGRVLATLGGEPAWLLAVSGTYAAGDLVAVLRNPWDGRAEIVLGKLPPGALVDAPMPEAPSGEIVTTTTLIAPTSTGAWAEHGGWADGTMRQGVQPETGRLVGLATYGPRIVELRAIELVKLEVLLRAVPAGGVSPVRLSAAPYHARPSGEPVGGDVALGVPLAPEQTRWADLVLDAEHLDDFRTGALRALVLDGTGYRELHGRDVAGMTLRATYTRRT